MNKKLNRILAAGDQLELEIASLTGDSLTLLSALEAVVDNKLVINAKLNSQHAFLLSEKKVTLTTKKDTTGILNMNGQITQVERKGSEVVLVVSLTDTIEQTQRREYFRLPILRDVKLGQIGDPLREGFTQNISAGGMRCILATPIRQGASLSILLNLDQHDFTFKGRVLETIQLENQEQFILRIVFEDLSVEDKKKLVAYIFSEQGRQNMMKK